MYDFKELNVWKKSIEVAILTYKITGKEKFNLTSQVNRASVSISANIADVLDEEPNQVYNSSYILHQAPHTN
jgi:four helix bundle protein